MALEIGLATGGVPPFQLSRRQLAHLGLAASWRVADPVALRLDYALIRARWPNGEVAQGSGDLRLGTAVRLWGGLWLDWEVKLPNAADELRLGSDETDWTGRLWWVYEGRVRVEGGAGLAILGDPLEHAAQDDAAVFGLSLAAPLGPVVAHTAVEGRLPSARNPADVELSGALGLPGERVQGGLEGRVGLTPAAVDFGLRLWVGVVGAPHGA